MPQVGEIFSCGVDWITATFQPDDAGAAALGNVCHKHWSDVEQAGGKVEIIAPLGYDGVRAGGVFFGSRPDSHMVQMSGAIANVWYKHLLKYGCEPRIKRLDLEVTAYREPGDFGFAPRLRSEVRRFETMKGRARPTVLGTVDKNLSGDSLMVGVRDAEFHFRFYDKSDESKGLVPPDLTRCESENKGVLAVRLWKELAAGTGPQVLARNHNLQRCLKVGIEPEWAEHAVPEHFTPTRPKEDDFRSLMWLANNVSQTVARLLERGYEHEIINALGLQEIVTQLALEQMPALKQKLTAQAYKAPPKPPRLETFLSPQGAREILARREQEREQRTEQRLREIAKRDGKQDAEA